MILNSWEDRSAHCWVVGIAHRVSGRETPRGFRFLRSSISFTQQNSHSEKFPALPGQAVNLLLMDTRGHPIPKTPVLQGTASPVCKGMGCISRVAEKGRKEQVRSPFLSVLCVCSLIPDTAPDAVWQLLTATGAAQVFFCALADLTCTPTASAWAICRLIFTK